MSLRLKKKMGEKILRRFETAVSSSVRNNAVKQALFLTEEETAVSKRLRIFSPIFFFKRRDTNFNLPQEYPDLHALHSFNAVIRKMAAILMENNRFVTSSMSQNIGIINQGQIRASLHSFKVKPWALSIQPKFPKIPVQN